MAQHEQEQGSPAIASARSSTARTDKMLANFMLRVLRLPAPAAMTRLES